MAHTFCTFNVNNLYARYKFGRKYPGDLSGKSAVKADWGYLPLYEKGLIELFSEEQRALAATALARGGAIKPENLPDVVCLQEVESLLALRRFNEEYLGNAYRYALLIDGRDLRQIDVAILSNLKILDIRTHVDDREDPADGPESNFTFSRDCLEVMFALEARGAKTVTVFLNHLKSKFAKTAAEKKRGDQKRKEQAERVRDIVQERFGNRPDALYAVVGDFNDQPASPFVAPLVKGAGLINALERIPNEVDRWTHWWRGENTVSQLDHVLLSPALAAATEDAIPEIERRAIGFERVLKDGSPGPKATRFKRTDDDSSPDELPFQFDRFEAVTEKDYGSDHCPVFFEVP